MAYSTIPKGNLYMNTVLYSGTGSEQTVANVNFQPDMTWLKSRTNSQPHMISDAVRGGNKQIYPNDSGAETSYSQYLKSFNSDGFVLGTDGGINASGQTYASWNWKANGQGSANTDGSINTTYTSVNTTAGFSISKYTGNGTNGATVGHGLGVIPDTVWIKRLSNADGMICYHSGLGNAASVKFDRTDYSTGNFWNSTTPTNQVVSMTNSTECNQGSSNDYVMYAFAEKQGFSKFGRYYANGSSNGTLTYTGFKPSFIIIKDVSGTRSWIMVDNKRNTFNVVNNRLFCDAADAQNTAVDALDFLSNGFKIRSSNSSVGENTHTYIYFAFASNPFVATSGTTAVPVTAE